MKFFDPHPSIHSEMYGMNEMRTRGFSVNFSGLRGYHFGDSIRHIAWRKTARVGSLIVKEFEKVVNADVMLVLNLNPNQHVGNYERSTWNSVRDLALAVSAQVIEDGNSISFAYNHGFFPRAYGADQLAVIANQLIQFDMYNEISFATEDLQYEGQPLFKYASLAHSGGTLVYVDTLNHSLLEQQLMTFKSLIINGVAVVLFLVKPDEEIFNSRHFQSAKEMQKAGLYRLTGIFSELQKWGATIFLVDMGRPLTRTVMELDFLAEHPAATEVSHV